MHRTILATGLCLAACLSCWPFQSHLPVDWNIKESVNRDSPSLCSSKRRFVILCNIWDSFDLYLKRRLSANLKGEVCFLYSTAVQCTLLVIGCEITAFRWFTGRFCWYYSVPFVQKLKSYLVRTQSLNVLALQPEVGQYPGLTISFVPPSPIFLVVFDQCCWLLYCCWLPSRALLS